MKTILNNIIKYTVLFFIGGVVYCGIELIYRGRTHWTMFLVGGLCFLFCGSINEVFDWDMLVWKQMFICAVGITIIEFVSGVIINIVFGLHVWDYSNIPFNILGQICLPFSVIWFFISFFAIMLDDWLRHWLFGEEKPHYRFIPKFNFTKRK